MCPRCRISPLIKRIHPTLFPRATVHIQVNDVNEYAPVFKEKSYKATAIEGKRSDNILKVEAVDADCSPQFSQICSYEIVTPEVPFAIDKDGKAGGLSRRAFPGNTPQIPLKWPRTLF